MLEELKSLNPDLSFFTLEDKNELYEKVDVDVRDLIHESVKLDMNIEGNRYIGCDEECSALYSVNSICRNVFAELPIQSGWCWGNNVYMNGMEWHKSSEVVVALSDCVLLLGSFNDVIDDVYDSKNAIALYLKKGQSVELRPMTLHLAPLPIEQNFKVAIILPKGTNEPLKSGIFGSLRAVNKWLLVHKENKKGIELGGKIGIIGDNISLRK